ncbi:MAG: DUF349 domain-containing protein [Bacteroidales bacterium]|nr:DUF349 domain-containing protein [Bacteroidales bacterium]
MESKDLLHPENENNQTPEVNNGASMEDQNNASQTEIPSEEVVDVNEPQAEVETTVEQTAEPTVEQPIEQSVEQPAEQPIEEPAEQTIEPTAEVVVEPVAEPAEETTSVVETTPSEKPASESASASDIMSEIEETESAKSEEEEEEEEDENVETAQITVEEWQKQYGDYTFEQLVQEIDTVAQNENYNQIKNQFSVLKTLILEQIKIDKKNQFDQFIEQGGEKEEFEYETTELEKTFNKAFSNYKKNRVKFLEKLELERQQNLEAKNKIIEGLKSLVETETNLKILNDQFKQFQDEWRSIGPVPQNETANLWQNYHFYVEKFFDILRMNKELRSLDLRKNLEQKVKLCEAAESLLLEDSINKSFKLLQQYHNDWKEIGPVPEEKKEEIWERFKNASDQVNQRRREYYDKLYTEQQNNYNAKLVLCEQVEELIKELPQNARDYNAVSEQLTEVLKVWKSLGQAPAKLNDEIWERFKKSLDYFFESKKSFFKQIKETYTQNHNLKVNLAIRAEAIATRTDWRQATDDIIALQKEWKEIGPSTKKSSEMIWKRFRAACDQFFEAKSHYFANAKAIEAENLAKKEEIIKNILEYEFTDNKSENMEAMKKMQREFLDIGFVPRKEKDRIFEEYRAAVNKRFAELKISNEEVKKDFYKSKIKDILDNPNADRILDKEKRFLHSKLRQLKEDIALWENNLGFFANSKNADLLKAEFEKKIEAAKKEVEEIQFKLKMMNQKQ